MKGEGKSKFGMHDHTGLVELCTIHFIIFIILCTFCNILSIDICIFFVDTTKNRGFKVATRALKLSRPVDSLGGRPIPRGQSDTCPHTCNLFS